MAIFGHCEKHGQMAGWGYYGFVPCRYCEEERKRSEKKSKRKSK
jgi:hypothetical protein